jgi:hypothetical protein
MRTLLPLLFLAACAPVDSDRPGRYAVDATFDPDPPVVGPVAVGLDVTDLDGVAVSGCAITMEGMMPAHGHGGIPAPMAEDLGDGHYTIDWTCAMAGAWELTFELACPAGDDTEEVDVDVD